MEPFTSCVYLVVRLLERKSLGPCPCRGVIRSIRRSTFLCQCALCQCTGRTDIYLFRIVMRRSTVSLPGSFCESEKGTTWTKQVRGILRLGGYVKIDPRFATSAKSLSYYLELLLVMFHAPCCGLLYVCFGRNVDEVKDNLLPLFQLSRLFRMEKIHIRRVLSLVNHLDSNWISQDPSKKKKTTC